MCHLDTLPSEDATGIPPCGDKRGLSKWLVRGQLGRPILDCLTLSVRRRAASSITPIGRPLVNNSSFGCRTAPPHGAQGFGKIRLEWPRTANRRALVFFGTRRTSN